MEDAASPAGYLVITCSSERDAEREDVVRPAAPLDAGRERDLRRRAASTTRIEPGDREAPGRDARRRRGGRAPLAARAGTRGCRRRQRGRHGRDGRGAGRARPSRDRVPCRSIDAVRRPGRLEGYRRGLEEAGILVDERLVIHTRASTRRRRPRRRHAARRGGAVHDRLRQRPLAMGALARLAELGIAVPGECRSPGSTTCPSRPSRRPACRRSVSRCARWGGAGSPRRRGCWLAMRSPTVLPRSSRCARPRQLRRPPRFHERVARWSGGPRHRQQPRDRRRGRRQGGWRGATVAVHYREAADGAARTRARSSGRRGRRLLRRGPSDGAAAEGLVESVLGHSAGSTAGQQRRLTQVGPFLEMPAGGWDAVIRTDLTAAFHTCAP